MNIKQDSSVSHWLRSRTGVVFLAFLGIATFYLATEHTPLFLGFLPYALLLLCPLLHLFMHDGHGDHGAHTGHKGHAEGQEPPSQGEKS